MEVINVEVQAGQRRMGLKAGGRNDVGVERRESSRLPPLTKGGSALADMPLPCTTGGYSLEAFSIILIDGR